MGNTKVLSCYKDMIDIITVDHIVSADTIELSKELYRTFHRLSNNPRWFEKMSKASRRRWVKHALCVKDIVENIKCFRCKHYNFIAVLNELG